MTPDQQRIAIAEACGWKWWTHPEGKPKLSKPRDEAQKKYWIDNGAYPIPADAVQTKSISANQEHEIPNYLNDLNAMHEAEKILEVSDNWLKYCHVLAKIVDPNNNTKFQTCLIWPTTWPLLHATAAQRAEAFLRTIGKWKE